MHVSLLTGYFIHLFLCLIAMYSCYRDYCCLRQHLTDATGRMVILSRTTNHSKCPEQKKNWRVKDYQSTMAIRPTNHPDKPGVEFSLTGKKNIFFSRLNES